MRNLPTYIVVLVRVLYRVMALDTRSFFVLWRAAILAAGLSRWIECRRGFFRPREARLVAALVRARNNSELISGMKRKYLSVPSTLPPNVKPQNTQ